MSYIDDKSVQRGLQAATFYHGKIDGDFGKASLAAGRALLASIIPASSYKTTWPDARVRAALDQWMMTTIGISVGVIDGIAGARTQVGAEKWQDHVAFVGHPFPPAAPAGSTLWPLQRDVQKFYGEPGKNQARLESPYPLYLDWALGTKVSGFSIHEKIHDAALRVMKRVLEYYGEEEIHKLGLDQFGGCLNVRPMRNGTTLSMHSWGIAIDWDADRNPLRATSKTAMMATQPYARFLDLWEAEGFVSLGRERNYDWMHVQAARL